MTLALLGRVISWLLKIGSDSLHFLTCRLTSRGCPSLPAANNFHMPKVPYTPQPEDKPCASCVSMKKNKVKYFLNRSHITSMPSGMKSGSVPKLSSDALPMPEMQLSPHSASLKQVCISNLVSPCNF